MRPVQRARPVRAEAPEVGLDPDVDRGAPADLALELEPDLLRDDAAGPVGADQVVGLDPEGLAGHAIADTGQDAAVCLADLLALGVEEQPSAARQQRLRQDRLQLVLRDIDGVTRRQPDIAAGAAVMIGAQAAELVPGQGDAPDDVADQVVRMGRAAYGLFQAEPAQQLHRPRIDVMGPGRVGRPSVTRYRQRGHAVLLQQQAGGQSGWPGAHDQDGSPQHGAICPGPDVFVFGSQRSVSIRLSAALARRDRLRQLHLSPRCTYR